MSKDAHLLCYLYAAPFCLILHNHLSSSLTMSSERSRVRRMTTTGEQLRSDVEIPAAIPRRPLIPRTTALEPILSVQLLHRALILAEALAPNPSLSAAFVAEGTLDAFGLVDRPSYDIRLRPGVRLDRITTRGDATSHVQYQTVRYENANIRYQNPWDDACKYMLHAIQDIVREYSRESRGGVLVRNARTKSSTEKYIRAFVF